MSTIQNILGALYEAGLTPERFRFSPKKRQFVVWCQWQNDVSEIVGTLPAEFSAVSFYREEVAGQDLACITFVL